MIHTERTGVGYGVSGFDDDFSCDIYLFCNDRMGARKILPTASHRARIPDTLSPSPHPQLKIDQRPNLLLAVTYAVKMFANELLGARTIKIIARVRAGCQ